MLIAKLLAEREFSYHLPNSRPSSLREKVRAAGIDIATLADIHPSGKVFREHEVRQYEAPRLPRQSIKTLDPDQGSAILMPFSTNGCAVTTLSTSNSPQKLRDHGSGSFSKQDFQREVRDSD